MDIPQSGVIKCHKCRHVLLEDISTISNRKSMCNQQCTSYNLNNFLYIAEDILPDWIKIKVEGEQWTKGKLTCAQCGSKVGSFDYVSGRKCECGESVLPPVHFVSSQVDKPLILK